MKYLLLFTILGTGLISFSQEKSTPKKEKSELQSGKDFFAENSKRKDVVTLASGLQYEIITEGNGPKPGPTDKVKTHYHGTLLNGTVFDSSVERGTPLSFPVNRVIKGWTEALQLMRVGSKWKLYIPSHLAYGERGAGAKIKPNAALIFEVELIEIEK
ncbi:MAG: FKBP-type peptidyl-prolyl cis-trans isomerase [Crocinitomicaceae bacterium]|jgi:FKBP-type peptidyl-prolyl cis-trans isomerase FklB|nr:FKBP-type peptidyl-prolyl cis-trans isomerase [Crocinitomicaceae bacterium]MBT5402686.1 FKBP-type peptidyl-prolyl cis-trans isomerase [Crocinitomicaceae bacterium]